MSASLLSLILGGYLTKPNFYSSFWGGILLKNAKINPIRPILSESPALSQNILQRHWQVPSWVTTFEETVRICTVTDWVHWLRSSADLPYRVAVTTFEGLMGFRNIPTAGPAGPPTWRVRVKRSRPLSLTGSEIPKAILTMLRDCERCAVHWLGRLIISNILTTP